MRITESSLRRTIRKVIQEAEGGQEKPPKRIIGESEVTSHVKRMLDAQTPRLVAAWEQFLKTRSEPVKVSMECSFTINRDGTVKDAAWKETSRSESLKGADLSDFIARITREIRGFKFCDPAKEEFHAEVPVSFKKVFAG